MIFHHFVSWARMSNAVLFTTAAFVCPCWPLLIWFLVFGLAYTALALYTVKFGPKAEYFAMKDKLLPPLSKLPEEDTPGPGYYEPALRQAARRHLDRHRPRGVRDRRRQRLLRAARVRPPRCRELPVLVDQLRSHAVRAGDV